MTHMDETTLRVLRVLENHRRLDSLQVASTAGIAVSAAEQALHDLEDRGLVRTNAEPRYISYSLDQKALSKQLQLA